MKAIKGDAVDASFGQQIRNYVLHPYKATRPYFLVDVVVDDVFGVVAAESLPPPKSSVGILPCPQFLYVDTLSLSNLTGVVNVENQCTSHWYLC
jgi:hypothetical protein